MVLGQNKYGAGLQAISVDTWPDLRPVPCSLAT